MNEIEEMSYFNRGYREGYEIGRNMALQEVVKMLDEMGREDLSDMVLGIEEGEEFQPTLL